MTSAIVTGATGFLGAHLVSLLEARGYQVEAFGRDQAKGQELRSERVNFTSVDIADADALEKAFSKVDVVFHCAAWSRPWGKKEDFHRVNVVGTRNMLRSCERNKIKKLVFVSSTSVYFDFKDKRNISEKDTLPRTFVNDYAATKYEAERVLLSESCETEVTILRPRGIIGDGDTSIMPRILRVMNKGVFPSVNNGAAVVDLTYVKNVAYALLLAGEKHGIHKRCFNISNLEPLSVNTLLQYVLARRKRACNFVPVSYSLLYGLAWCLEVLAKVFAGGEPIITRYSVGLLAKTQTLDTSAAERELGYKPLYSIREGIDFYLAWEQRSA